MDGDAGSRGRAARDALERFVGGADAEPAEPFDIAAAREQMADDRLARHDEIAADWARRAAAEADSGDAAAEGEAGGG